MNHLRIPFGRPFASAPVVLVWTASLSAWPALQQPLLAPARGQKGDGCDLVSKHCRLSYVQVAYKMSSVPQKKACTAVSLRGRKGVKGTKKAPASHMLRFYGSISSEGCTQPHTTEGFCN